MMRIEDALKQNTVLRFNNHDGGAVTYTIRKVIGRGGTCIVYDAYYINNTGRAVAVRIKECCPCQLNLKRETSGKLSVKQDEQKIFEMYKEGLRVSFEVNNELFAAGGLTNMISNPVDLYEANHTLYIVLSYNEGTVLSLNTPSGLKQAIAAVKSTAEAIERIHDKGYLYLDIKPDNIFVLKETTDFVQLFDFDSLIPLDVDHQTENCKIAYTRGYSAPELRSGRMNRTGKYTDVYGTGALLFYLVFGRTPNASDCDMDIEYDFTQSVYDMDQYRDRLLFILTDFFHHTLAGFYKDRYQEMKAVISVLNEAEKYADLTVPFIFNTQISVQDEIIGRSEEMNVLSQWFANREKKCLFISGMGGIGKTTLVKSWIVKKSSEIDTVLYLDYQHSIQNTITDDGAVCINTVEKIKEESQSEYFKRKLNSIRKMTAGTKTVLVMDNYDGRMDAAFAGLMNTGCKLIMITRSDVTVREYDILKVGALDTEEACCQLFTKNLGRRLAASELPALHSLIRMTAGHTLILELIAKQVSRSYISVEAAAFLARVHGIAGVADEKVDYVRDGQLHYEQVSHIITALFSVGKISAYQQVILKTLSLFQASGIDMDIFTSMFQLQTKDVLNGLRDEGWLNIECRMLKLHPVIREAIGQWGWEERFTAAAETVLTFLLGKVRTDGSRQEDLGRQQACELDKYLRLTEGVLKSSGRERHLCQTELYTSLLYYTVINMPRDREDFIMPNAEKLFAEQNIKNAENAERLLKLYDYIIFLHCEKGEFEQAHHKLLQAKAMIKGQNSHYLWGLYYDMQGMYYDFVLDGAYCAAAGNTGASADAGTAGNSRSSGAGGGVRSAEAAANSDNMRNLAEIEKERIRKRMLLSMDKAIGHMKKSQKPDSKRLLAKYMIGQAAFLIRICPKEKTRIKALLDIANGLVKIYTSEYSETRKGYYLACAWYYTLTAPSYKNTVEYMKTAYETAKKSSDTELEFVDYIIVPFANMFVEWGRFEKAEKWLKQGIKICRKHTASIPYIRKKRALYGYLLDTYYIAGNLEECRCIAEKIDAENERIKVTECLHS